MARTGVVAALVLLCGCTTVAQEGELQSIAPFKSSSNVGNLGNAAWVIILPGIVVGTAVGTAIGPSYFPMPDAAPERTEQISQSVDRLGAAQGFVVVEAEPALRFELVDGKARLPIEQVWRYDLGRLLVNGVLVQLDDGSRPLAVQLSSCRRAVSRWQLGSEGSCDQERERWIWAKTCHASGFGYADQVLARLQSLGCP